jgi:glyceraldehyde-3-phosphate dehydrogenase (NADP+)
MDQKYPIYVAGSFRETNELLPVVNPYTGENAGITFLAGEDELENAIRGALAVQDELAELPAWLRYRALSGIASMMQDARDEFGNTISLESGKPIRDALAETDRAIQTFTVAAEECKRHPAEYIDMEWTPAGEGKEGLLRYFPLGLVAGISPFNFPLNLAVHKIAPAIAAGCPIILKPSSSTPLSTLLLSRMIARTGLPGGAVSVLPMNRQTGNRLVTDNRFAMLTFTGSPEVGWNMKSDAGRKKVVLELGGNAGVIVGSGADTNEAVRKCVKGGYAYSGQVCIHTQRIFVHESLFEEFLNNFVNEVKMLRHGNPLEQQTDISVMIDEANAIRVENWVNEAINEGAGLLCGGKRTKNYMQPTVLTGTTEKMKVCAQEVFGPVVSINAYKNFNDALNSINNSRYGLQAGLFTDSLEEMNLAFRKLQVGGIMINDVPGFRVDHMPYGGVKDSGDGREGVKYSIHDMLEPRLLVKNK